MVNRKAFLSVLFLSFLGLLLPTPGLADTHNWVGADGYWNVPGNWDPAVVPGQNDKAIINNNHVVTITSNPAMIHQLEVGSTSALYIGVSPGGASLWFQSSPTTDYILNHGTIRVGFSGYPGNIACWGDTVPLQGTGTLVLGGIYPNDALTGQGGSFINTAGHTIRGGGQIQALSANQGQVIADNGTLEIKSPLFPVDNNGGTMSVSGSGNVLYINSGAVSGGAINPQDGKVALFAGMVGNVTFGPGSVEVRGDVGETSTLQNTVTLSSGTTLTTIGWTGLYGDPTNTVTLVNNGTILVTPTDADRLTYISGDITFHGPGLLTMGGEGNYIYGTTNSASHTIQGGGTIGGYMTNNGVILANNGILNMDYVTGTGTISVADGAALNVTHTLQTGDLNMSPGANLTALSGAYYIDLKRNFSFAQTNPSQWNWGNYWLYMSGGTGRAAPQTLEVGCRDDGANDSGYTNNFVLPNLRVTGANTYVSLVDAIDNGHWAAGRETLYVTTLQVTSGATLNLNGRRLYAKQGGIIYRVKAGQGSLYGGGTIIDTAAAGAGANFLLLLE